MALIALPSPNHDARPLGVRPSLVILHYTGMRSAAAALDRLRDAAAKVSAHYVVGEAGDVLALVPEQRRAWHAGLAGWGAIDDVNSHSIGIELINPGHDWGYRPFPKAQIAAAVALCTAIRARHAMPAKAIIGHSDVAPARKTDPGELFPWAQLAGHGLGIWPEAAPHRPVDPAMAIDGLRTIGYRLDLPHTLPVHLIAAFQRHWRPQRVDGGLDRQTMGLIVAVASLSAMPQPPT